MKKIPGAEKEQTTSEEMAFLQKSKKALIIYNEDSDKICNYPKNFKMMSSNVIAVMK